MKYRDAIRSACLEWGKGGLFRSKSSESQNAVDAIAVAMSSATDESLAELVNWLVGLSFAQPHAFSYLDPIKAKCKLRDLLNGALLVADPPIRRVQRSYVAPKTAEKPKKKKTVVPQPQSSAHIQPKATTTTTTVQPKPTPKPTPTPQITIQPSVVIQPTVVVVPTPVKKATRYLMNDCVEASGGTVEDFWTQTSICSRLGIHSANFEGFCAAATGRWLKSGDIKSFKGQKGSIDTIHLQSKYEHGKENEEEFYTNQCGLTDLVGSSEAEFLTAEKVLLAIEAHKGATRHLLAIVPLAKGDGHAIGIITGVDGYLFLDVNEGLARLPSRGAFWSFLWKYVHDTDMGLLKQQYGAFWVSSWK